MNQSLFNDTSLPSDDGSEAMQALAGGNDDALNRIIDRWQSPIISYLYRQIGNIETARDLAQEVFVRLYKYRNTYKSGSSFSSYIFTIATNLAKNHRRWKGRHPETELDEDWGGKTPGEGISHINPSGYLEKTEDQKKVRLAIQDLPEKLRTPLILFYYEELPQSEIATILTCTEKTVETRIYRARNILKEKLAPN